MNKNSTVRAIIHIVRQPDKEMSPMLELESPDSLVKRVVDAIRAEIDSGRLAAEARLPTEHQLAERLNVSRSVIREAVEWRS